MAISRRRVRSSAIHKGFQSGSDIEINVADYDASVGNKSVPTFVFLFLLWRKNAIFYMFTRSSHGEKGVKNSLTGL
jgi:hypothetical protein